MDSKQVFLNLCEIAQLERDFKRGNISIVAKMLKKEPKTFSRSLKVESLPLDDILKFCEEKGWSPSWIFFNLGPKKLKNLIPETIHKLTLEEKEQLIRMIDNFNGIGRVLYAIFNRREERADTRKKKIERRKT